MSTKLARYNFHFFDAFNASKLDDFEYRALSDSAAKYSNGLFGNMNRGEFGCSLSHLYLYEYMVANNIPTMIVLEDDVTLTKEADLFFDHVQQQGLPEGTELVMLGYSKNARTYDTGIVRSIWKRKKIGHFKAGMPIHRLYGSYGYLITLEGARKLLRYGGPVRMPADILLNNSVNAGITFIALRKPIILPDEDNDISLIGKRNDFFFQEGHEIVPSMKIGLLKRMIPGSIRRPLGRMMLRLKNQLYLWRIFHPRPWTGFTYDF